MNRISAVFLALACAVTVARSQAVNNNFASPVVVNVNSYSSNNIPMGSNTKEPGEPDHGGKAGGRSAWWLWTPTATGVYSVHTRNSGAGVDTLLAVYANTGVMPVAANLIAQCDNITTNNLHSAVYVRAVAGTSYRIAVDTAAPGAGNALLSILSEPSPPAHDSFANAQVLAGAFPLAANAASNAKSTVEPGEPIAHSDRGPQPSVWYKFTPTANAIVTVTATPANPATTLTTGMVPQWSVYTGASVSTLTRVGAQFPFAVTAGTPYYVQVTGQGFHAFTKEGSFNLSVAVASGISEIVLPPESSWEWMHPLDASDPSSHPDWVLTWQFPGDPTEYFGNHFQSYAKAPFGFGGIEFLPGTTTSIGTTAPGLANNAAYFRTDFLVTSPVTSLWAEVQADDGAWIYLDGGAPVPVNITQADAHFTTPPPFSILQPRAKHTATLLPDGRVLYVGGQSNTAALVSAELYNPALRSSAATAPLTGARYAHTANLLPNGKVLVAGGFDGATNLASSRLYDPATGLWTSTGNMVTGRRDHTAVLLNDGRILVNGGVGIVNVTTGATNALDSVEIYNPATGVWTALPDKSPQVRERHTSVRLPDGKVLACNGSSGTAARTSGEVFDPATGKWTATPGLVGRYSHTAILLNSGKVLLAGGANTAGQGLRESQLYDPVTKTVGNVGPLAQGRSHHTASLLSNGLVLVAGGRNGANATFYASCELYDPASGVWRPTGAMPVALASHTATVLPDGRVLVAGGVNGSGPQKVTLVYSYSTGIWASPSAPFCLAANSDETETKTKRVLLNANGAPIAPGFHSIAVSVHQVNDASSDLGFDMMLYEALVPSGRAFPSPRLYAYFQAPAVGAASHPGTGAELGWTRSGSATVQVESSLATTFQTGSLTNKHIRLQNSSAIPLVTEAVDVSALSTYKAAVKLRAFTSDGTGFEIQDRIQVYLETSQDGVNFTPAGDLQPFLSGGGPTPDSILFEIGPPESYARNTKNPEWIERRLRIENNTAKSARLVVDGLSDQTTDFILVDDLGFEKVGCRIFAFVRERTYNNQGDDILANDTWSFNPMIVSEDAGTGWQASLSNFTGPTPIFQSGSYTNAVPIGPMLVSGGTRTLTFRDSATPSCTVTVTGSPPTCSMSTPLVLNKSRDPGPTPSMTDDTVVFDLVVTANNASTGWYIATSDLPGGATGLYGEVVRVTMPASPASRNLVVRDRANTACTATITVSVPATTVYVIGDLLVEGLLSPVTTALNSIPPAGWRIPQDKFMRNNNGGSAVLTSEWVDFGWISGPIDFEAVLSAHESSNASNFEGDDRFRLELILDTGGVLSTNNLILGTVRDKNSDGYWTGASGTYAASNDEFNVQNEVIGNSISNRFAFAYAITSTVDRARVVITGATNSDTEKLDVQNLRFKAKVSQDLDEDGMWDQWETQYLGSTNAMPGDDFDADGMTNYEEFVAGTRPNNPLEFLEVVSTTLEGENLTFSWSSRPGKYYQLMEGDSPFPDGAWIEVGDRILSEGDAQTSVTYPAATSIFSNRYYRIKVLP